MTSSVTFARPKAIPFLVDLARRDPLNIPDDVVEALVQFGAAAVDPVLGLLEELEEAGEDEGDVPFLLSQLRVRDPRILRSANRSTDRRRSGGGAVCGHVWRSRGDSGAGSGAGATPAREYRRGENQGVHPGSRLGKSGAEEQEEPFDIWALYPKTDWPPLELLDDEVRLEMLESGSAELRADVAEFYRGAGVH